MACKIFKDWIISMYDIFFRKSIKENKSGREYDNITCGLQFLTFVSSPLAELCDCATHLQYLNYIMSLNLPTIKF